MQCSELNLFHVLSVKSQTQASVATSRLFSSPAGPVARSLGRESLSLDLAQVYILIMFPFILFLSCVPFIPTCLWKTRSLTAFFIQCLLFELFFAMGLAAEGGVESMAFLPLFEPGVSALPMKLVGRHCFLLWGNHLGWRQLLEATMTVGGAGLPSFFWFPGRDSGFNGQNKAPSVGTEHQLPFVQTL